MKTFQGIITNWTRIPTEGGLGFRVGGNCLRHEDQPAPEPNLRHTTREARIFIAGWDAHAR